MTFSAVLFDLDGTLLDTLADLADSANMVLADMGHPVHPVDAYRYFVGDGIRVLAQRVLPESVRDEQTVQRYVEAMRAVYAERQTIKTRPYEGVVEMLAALEERGLTMAILSNKPDDATRSIVKALLPARVFTLVRGVLPGGPIKPDPAGAIAVAAELGIPCREFLYLGDTSIDMKTAISAGMYAVGALWGFRDEAELRERGQFCTPRTNSSAWWCSRVMSGADNSLLSPLRGPGHDTWIRLRLPPERCPVPKGHPVADRDTSAG